MFETGASHMNMGPSHMLHCIYVLMSVHDVVTCHYCPGYGMRPIDLQTFCNSQVTDGFSPLFTQTKDSSTLRQPERAASACWPRACLPYAWFCGQVPACA